MTKWHLNKGITQQAVRFYGDYSTIKGSKDSSGSFCSIIIIIIIITSGKGGGCWSRLFLGGHATYDDRLDSM